MPSHLIHKEFRLRVLAGYALPTGSRHLVLLWIPGPKDTYLVLDIPTDPLTADDGDVYLVGHGWHEEPDACSAGFDYMLRSEELGRPAAADA